MVLKVIRKGKNYETSTRKNASDNPTVCNTYKDRNMLGGDDKIR